MSDRLNKLLAMLQKEPNDTFLLYGIALEYKKANDSKLALDFLNRVIGLDAGYCYAYHQKGLIFEQVGDVESARQAYRDGVAAAKKKGDAHAEGEIAAALEMIE
jgi:Tfp pilus assembly protein PilF